MSDTSMVLVTATIGHPETESCIASWGSLLAIRVDGRDGLLGAYQLAYVATSEDIIAYVHDDVIIREPGWRERVLREFDEPTVGLVGFGGALRHGSPDLYRRPYDYRQLGRSGYLSNVDDAEVHGERFDGSCDVAVVDGFFIALRRKVLDLAGGWPTEGIKFHNYDYWASCVTHRHGFKVRMVGVRCHHLGGRTSVGLKMDDGDNHGPAHRWVYDNFADVLPWGEG